MFKEKIIYYADTSIFLISFFFGLSSFILHFGIAANLIFPYLEYTYTSPLLLFGLVLMILSSLFIFPKFKLEVDDLGIHERSWIKKEDILWKDIESIERDWYNAIFFYNLNILLKGTEPKWKRVRFLMPYRDLKLETLLGFLERYSKTF